MTARVAVGMPCFNAERWVGAAIESILTQTHGDFVLVVSDNASIDSTWDVVNGYARMDRRIRVLRNAENLGAAANFNRVFALAEAPYFKWASSNDLCAPTFLERCVDVLTTDPDTVLVCPRGRMFEENVAFGVDYPHGLDLTHPDACERFLGAMSIRRNVTMNGVVRSEALRRTELIRPYWGSDLVMIAALALQGRIREWPEPLLYVRDTPATSTAKMSAEEAREHHGPAMASRMTNQSLKLWSGYRRAVAAAGLPLGDRFRLMLHLARMARWSSGAILREAAESMRQALASRSARSSANDR